MLPDDAEAMNQEWLFHGLIALSIAALVAAAPPCIGLAVAGASVFAHGACYLAVPHGLGLDVLLVVPGWTISGLAFVMAFVRGQHSGRPTDATK